jgi:signal transduction histidine kinase
MRRLTIRARLTLLYTALFSAAGVVLLAVTYVLIERQLPVGGGMAVKIQNVNDLPPVTTAGTPMRESFVRALEAQVADIRQATLTTFFTQGGITFLITIAVAAGFAWLIAGQALQPLQRITETAGRIAHDGRGLHQRIALSGPSDEVKNLADTFDQMLARLDNSFDGQRRFVANASHELRTPLALNRALVELAISRTGVSADAQQLGEALLRVNERHEKLIDGLLMLADSETEITETTPVNLAEVACHLLDEANAGEIKVSRTLDRSICAGDPILLERIAQNLIENAIRHNVKGGWVHVSTSTVDGRARLTVTNTGPVIPTYEIETMFLPFRRLGRERVHERGTDRGLGLGLSIVRAIASAHRAEVTAIPRPAGGLTITFTSARR